MKKVAVTGTIASGKSTVCQILKELGAYVISADEVVHELLSPTTELGKKVIDLLGSDIVIQGQLQRKLIADKVFNNPPLLKQLEQLLHPAVQQVMEARYREARGTLFVAEVPLLFEAGQEGFYGHVIWVTAPAEIASKRYKGDDFEKRTSRLLPESEKVFRCDFVINNRGSLEELQINVKNIHTQLIEDE